MVLVTINGNEMQLDDGTLILDAARQAGYEIPTFCHHAKLSKLGSCRMCLVEIEGMRKLQPSCVTPVMDGMKVHTESPDVVSARKAQLEFLLINHPLDCPVCDQAGECDLQDMTFKFGNSEGRYRWQKRTFPKRDMGHSIVKEMNRCIACRRCSRFCSEISGDYAISELNRGNELEMGTFCHTPVDSEFIGNTAQLCPVGALTSKHFRFKARTWDLMSTETICPHCSVGCSITSDSKYVSQKATQMLHTQSVGRTPSLEKTEVKVLRNIATEDKGVTEISICDRGRYGHHFISSRERLSSPLVRENGKLIKTSWDKALSIVASRLSGIMKSEGADAIGGITSGACTNEDGYLFQKFFRTVIGTNNIDIARRGVIDRASAVRLAGMRGMIRDVRDADKLLILGSSVSTDTPIVSMNAGIAARMGGARLITVTSGENRLVTSRPLALSFRRGNEKTLIGSITKTVIDGKRYVKAFAGSRKKELDAVAKGLERLNLDDSGISKEDLGRVARALAAGKKGIILFGDDMLSGNDASDVVQALYNLASLLGYNGDRGRIIYAPAAGNIAGSMDVGVAPDYLPGVDEVGSESTSKRFNLLWGVAPPENKGLGWKSMQKAASEDKLKGLYIMGDDPVATSCNRSEVKECLDKLDFLVVQDIFMTETAKLADVVLPAVSYAEKCGTVTNLEGRVQTISRSITPSVYAREDWRIICEVTDKMGGAMEYDGVDDITEEISKAVRHYEGATPEGVGRDGFVAGGTKSAQGPLVNIVIRGEGGGSDNKDYPFHIVPGRDVFLAGSLTWMDEGLLTLSGGGRVLVGEDDAGRLDLKDGDRVTVETEKGSISAEVKVTGMVGCGMVVVPTNHPTFDPWPMFSFKYAGVAGRLTKKD